MVVSWEFHPQEKKKKKDTKKKKKERPKLAAPVMECR